jgi:hypothetical protein
MWRGAIGFRLALGIAAVGAMLAWGAARAADDEAAKEEALKCADKAVSARGIGFLASQAASEEAARQAWLAKAQAIFGDAQWSTAKEPNIICAKQGLYSNCTASAVPCGTQAGKEPEAPKGN